MIRKTFSFCIIPALALLLAAGCGSHEESGDAAGTGSAGDIQVPNVKVNADLPDDFPKDVPVYSNMKVIFAAQFGSGYKVRGATQDDVATIDAFYKKHLADKGWARDEEQMSLDQANAKAYQYKKGEKTLVVKIVASNAETTIEMTYLAESLL
jgi:hypothetical protein